MKVLLHVCCGVCAGSVVERLLSEGHQVTGYFFNPNIHPAIEYEKRLQVAQAVAESIGFPLSAGEYKPESWLKATVGLEKETEGGRRCEVCYRLRLEAAFQFMQEHSFDVFTTTLTVSPHKPAVVVNRVGKEIGGDKFLARDFKKQDGFKRANEIAKKLGLYRQHYCGCVYSLNQPGHED
ncbi:MAG: epoxyqueuosine reductase QueH [Dehalococcoidales bacterium]|nr:epoxyqueuosine reductase QueH [Dehalococcoidales bacterium]